MPKLFIIRHAIAEDRETFSKTGQPDEKRPLTAEGEKKMRKIATHLFEKYSEIDHFFQSPLTRSQQTAEILRSEFKKSTLSTSEHLRPGSSFEALAKELKTYRKRNIAIIGHEDHLSHFTCYLMTGKMDGAFLKYKKGGGAILDFLGDIQPGEGQLHALFTPKLINC
jgi:phosphohistidine phosphatase